MDCELSAFLPNRESSDAASVGGQRFSEARRREHVCTLACAIGRRYFRNRQSFLGRCMADRDRLPPRSHVARASTISLAPSGCCPSRQRESLPEPPRAVAPSSHGSSDLSSCQKRPNASLSYFTDPDNITSASVATERSFQRMACQRACVPGCPRGR